VTVSVVIAFYNNYPLLELILRSLAAQFDGSFDVIIADDGSRQDVVDQIRENQHRYPFIISHIWQSDIGFRKNRILNRAIMASASDYLIFIDGDCIPQLHFVEDHREHAKRRTCLCGRRVDILIEDSGTLDLTHPETIFRNNFWSFLILAVRGKARNVEKGFRFRNNILEGIANRKRRGLLGCNFSLFREDFLAINGFDERYEGPGAGEDSDIEFRLNRQGVTMQSLVLQANMVHLDGGSLPRSPANLELFAQVIRDGNYWTPYGIKKD
jgi:GT2 family glycosyltransferase